ncbi:hypothetical protein Goarm_010309 [Gossypium armourianum]|uniref:DUF4283 domain-containing protein n=1 Tax=Gossypium armourianum TaxID=34283 RepID=A0A7J9JVM2_9ROSI|nr:hypothetical protein [Gossypium armourianum]
MKAVSIGVRTNEEDFELLEGEAKKEIIDGILSISFSERVHQFISKCMARTVPLKVIGLENDYFSVNFQDDDEYLHAVSGGPWTIFGQYLTVRPWTPSFTTDQDFPTSLLVWIRLPRLSEGILAIYIDLGKLLVPKLQIDERVQCVEYETIPLVCFRCGRFEHSSDACLHRSEKKKTIEGVTVENLDKDTTAQGGAADWSFDKDAMTHSSDKGDQFGPWMLVERKPHWTPLTATKPIVNSIDVGA